MYPEEFNDDSMLIYSFNTEHLLYWHITHAMALVDVWYPALKSWVPTTAHSVLLGEQHMIINPHWDLSDCDMEMRQADSGFRFDVPVGPL